VASIGFKVDAGAPDSRWALEVLRARFGIDAVLEELPGELDLNYAVRQDGVRTHVLKVMRPGCVRALVELQVGALKHAVGADSSLPLPRVVPDRLGETCIAVASQALRHQIGVAEIHRFHRICCHHINNQVCKRGKEVTENISKGDSWTAKVSVWVRSRLQASALDRR